MNVRLLTQVAEYFYIVVFLLLLQQNSLTAGINKCLKRAPGKNEQWHVFSFTLPFQPHLQAEGQSLLLGLRLCV